MERKSDGARGEPATQRLRAGLARWSSAPEDQRQSALKKERGGCLTALQEGADPNIELSGLDSSERIDALSLALELGDPALARAMRRLGAAVSARALTVAAKAAMGALPGLGWLSADERRAEYSHAFDALMGARPAPSAQNGALRAIAWEMRDDPWMGEELVKRALLHPDMGAEPAREAGRWASARGRPEFELMLEERLARARSAQALARERPDVALAFQVADEARWTLRHEEQGTERAYQLAVAAEEAVGSLGERAPGAVVEVSGEPMEAMALLAYLGAVDGALRLAGAGANPSARGPWGRSAATFAAMGALGALGFPGEELRGDGQRAYRELYEELLSSGADPRAKDRHERGLIHFLADNASHERAPGMIASALSAGADPEARDGRGELPGEGSNRALFEQIARAWGEANALRLALGAAVDQKAGAGGRSL